MALVAPTPQSSAERLLAELARTTPAMRATWALTLSPLPSGEIDISRRTMNYTRTGQY